MTLIDSSWGPLGFIFSCFYLFCLPEGYISVQLDFHSMTQTAPAIPHLKRMQPIEKHVLICYAHIQQLDLSQYSRITLPFQQKRSAKRRKQTSIGPIFVELKELCIYNPFTPVGVQPFAVLVVVCIYSLL